VVALSAKTAAFGVATALVALLGIELVVRIAFSLVSGESQLLYGFGSNEPEQKPGMLFPARTDPARWHAAMRMDDREKTVLHHATGSYSKYRPFQPKRTRDQYGYLSDIRINNLGFRGPDVDPSKLAGTFRVLVLGASSTFGYRNRDTETYPRYLEQLLDERLAESRRMRPGACAEVSRFEVLNLGIPHLNTANIRSLLVAEGFDLDPDLVTFYEGANETRLIEAGAGQRMISALGDRLILARFLRSLLQSYLSSFSADELRAYVDTLAENFFLQLSEIADASASHGVPLLVASQQARSFLVPRKQMNQVTYADERQRVESKLEREGRIGLKEAVFWMHAELMAGLRRWVTEQQARTDRDVDFVDVIAALDQNHARDQLISWVHLTAEGNRIVAAAFADPIFERACRLRSGTAAD